MRYAVFFVTHVIVLFVLIGCGGATAIPATPVAVPISMSPPSLHEKFRGYDFDSALVPDRQDLFEYFRRVTGSFRGLALVFPPLDGIAPNLQEELRAISRGGVINGVSIDIDISKLVKSEVPESQSQGNGVVIGNKILTVNHVADYIGLIDEVILFRNFPPELVDVYKYFTLLDRREESTSSYLVKKINGNSHDDWAWLSLHAEETPYELDFSSAPAVQIGSADKLELGNFLYVITNEGIKEAVVVSPEQMFGDNEWWNQSIYQYQFSRTLIGFLHGEQLNNGNSGSPIFALRDGAPELVGLVSATKQDNRHTGLMVNIEAVYNTFP